jgi:hypothetical protein
MIAITLTAEHWEQVLNILRNTPMPHRVSDPLISEIQGQCARHDEQARFAPPRAVGETDGAA